MNSCHSFTDLHLVHVLFDFPAVLVLEQQSVLPRPGLDDGTHRQPARLHDGSARTGVGVDSHGGSSVPQSQTLSLRLSLSLSLGMSLRLDLSLKPLFRRRNLPLVAHAHAHATGTTASDRLSRLMRISGVLMPMVSVQLMRVGVVMVSGGGFGGGDGRSFLDAARA